MLVHALLMPIMPCAFPTKVKHQVRKEQNGRCALCGDKTKLETHHIIPEHALLPRISGKNTRENAVGLCGDKHNACHRLADFKAINEGLFFDDGEFKPLDEISPRLYSKKY